MRLNRVITVLRVLNAFEDHTASQVIIGYCAYAHKRTGASFKDLVKQIPDRRELGRSEYIRYCSWSSRACTQAKAAGLVCMLTKAEPANLVCGTESQRVINYYVLTSAGCHALSLSEGL